MTTDIELRDLLSAEAGGAIDTAGGWDDVVRRGRHRRRTRRGQAMAGAVLVAGVAAAALALSADEPTVDTVPPVTEPTSTTATDGPGGTSSVERPFAFRVSGFRAQGASLTAAMLWDGELRGFDPCTALRPLVAEMPEDVTVELVGAQVEGAVPWAACGTGRMGSWATIELDDPVGERTVNGREVVDGTSLLLPEELPAPFELDRREEAASRASVPDEDGSLTPVWSWSFSWRAGMSGLRLSIFDVPGSSAECEAQSEDVEVRGTTARLCRGFAIEEEQAGVTYDLEWEDDGRPVHLSYQSLDPEALTVEDLLAIAEGLQPPG